MTRVFERGYGRVKIKVYGGWKEIGGNCIVVEDGDRRIVFDNGVRVSVFRKFYGGRVKPLGPSELRLLGVVPPLKVFEGASALYISHFHLDHVGLLSSVPPGVNVKVPSTRVLENTLASWYRRVRSWLAYVPPSHANKVEDVRSKRGDENNVIAIPVSHSCFPAYSFLYVGSDVTIFYSGDLRFEPLSNISRRLDEIIEDIGIDRVDVALLEGTNFSIDHALVSESMLRDYISLLLRKYGLVSISVDPLDLRSS